MYSESVVQKLAFLSIEIQTNTYTYVSRHMVWFGVQSLLVFHWAQTARENIALWVYIFDIVKQRLFWIGKLDIKAPYSILHLQFKCSCLCGVWNCNRFNNKRALWHGTNKCVVVRHCHRQKIQPENYSRGYDHRGTQDAIIEFPDDRS